MIDTISVHSLRPESMRVETIRCMVHENVIIMPGALVFDGQFQVIDNDNIITD